MQSHPELAGKIRDRLAILIERRRETQREIAAGTGVTLSVLNTTIRGKGVPSPDSLIRIADYYGVSLDWLCGRTDKRQRIKQKPAAV